nr:glycosyltransferase family 1 protein [Actinomyces procaprae]
MAISADGEWTVLGRRARVLFAPENFNVAEVTRGVAIARRLPPDVECVFAGYSDRNREIIEEAGFEYRLLSPRLDDADARALLALDQGRALRNPFTDELLAGRVASERSLIRDLRPSAVVIGATLSQFISARAEGVPLVFVRPFAYSLAHLQAVRDSSATGVLARTTPARQTVDDLVARALTRLNRHVRPPGSFRRIAKANGVHLDKDLVRFFTADLNLITTAAHLLPSWVDMPPGHRVVGPVYASLPGPVPPLVNELASRGEPVVYFAVGSSGGRELVLDVLPRLAHAPCQILAPVREHLNPRDLAGLPANVHVTGRLPADRLGGAVDLAITHGGEGTVQTSSVQGWPFIGIPLQFEQRFNIQRCVDYGSAVMARRREAADVDWPALVVDALNGRRLRARAERMALELRSIDGPAAAAAAITELISDGWSH